MDKLSPQNSNHRGSTKQLSPQYFQNLPTRQNNFQTYLQPGSLQVQPRLSKSINLVGSNVSTTGNVIFPGRQSIHQNLVIDPSSAQFNSLSSGVRTFSPSNLNYTRAGGLNFSPATTKASWAGNLVAGGQRSFPLVGNQGQTLIGGNSQNFIQWGGSTNVVAGTQQIGQKVVSYELKPVVKTEYVTVPVYETQYVSVPVMERTEGKVEVEITDELKECRLLVEEKDQFLLRLRQDNERLIMENKSLLLQIQEANQDRENNRGEGVKRHGVDPNRALIDEIEDLKKKLREKDLAYEKLFEENGRLKAQINEMQRDFETRITTIIRERDTQGKGQYDEFAKMKQGYEAQILALKGQITEIQNNYETRITTIIREKDTQGKGQYEELAKLRQSYEAQILALKGQITEIQNTYETRITTIIRERDTQGKGQYEELSRLRQNYEAQILALKGQITEIQNSYETRITTIIREKDINGGALKDQYEDKIRGLQARIDDMHLKLTQYESRINVLLGEKNNFELQIRDLNLRITQISSEYETRITTIIRERDDKASGQYESRIAVLIKEKDSLYAELINIKQSYESQFLMITKEKDGYILRIRELEKIIESLKIELQASKDNLIAYENKIAILSGELNRLKSMNTGKTTEIEELRRRTVEFESSSSSYQIRMSQYESQISSWSMKYQNNLALVALLCAEIEQLRGRFVERVE